jgi:predicted nicotinamide N-methyase
LADAPPRADTDPAGFIRAWTALAPPSLLPELRLYLAGPVTPLWEATEKTLEEKALPPPYWAFAWPGGQAIARHVLDHPRLVLGKRVLDFAAGSGVVGIAAAKAGAKRITATELDPLALVAIRLNALANGVAVDAIDRDVTTHDTEDDVILAGDVCYERAMAEAVWPWLQTQARRGVAVLLADPGRAYAPRTGLVELARYRVPTSLELEDRLERETVVYRVAG